MRTMVFGAETRQPERWRVYRICTANSTWNLEVETEQGKARRCAVLTCVAPPERAGRAFEDSAPSADEVSLFSLSPAEWIGKCLVVGTARTSQVQSVEFIGADEVRASIAKLQRAPGAVEASPRQDEHERRPAWAPFPAGHVEMAETAASLLKTVCHRHDLTLAVRHDPLLDRRLKLALAECGLMLEALSRRTG